MRPGLIAVCLWALPQAASGTPPPPPPPDPARLAAATEIWRDHPPPQAELAEYAKFRIREQIVSILDGAKVKRGGKAWYRRYALLEAHFWRSISSGVEGKREAFLECMATRYAWMELEQLRELSAFLATETGKAFWLASRLSDRDAFDCSRVFQDDISRHVPEGWELIGAKPPPSRPVLN
jgi:hypothetical protein